MPNHIFDLVDLRACTVGVGCLLGVAMSGCAVIDQVHGDGTISRSFVFGSPVIMPTDTSGKADIIKVTGLGLTGGSNTATLGWFNETIVALGPECRVVLIGNTEQELSRFAALLQSKETICDDTKVNGGQQ